MSRARVLSKSILAHRRKLLLASGTTAVTAASFLPEEASLPEFDGNGKVLLPNSYVLPNSLRLSTMTTECKEASSKDFPVTTIPIPSRAEQMAKLKSGDTFDILVVGGGATGSGAALDAATRGLSVAMIERGDFGNETSARSTKLVWAGIRYIATGLSALLRVRNITRPVDAVSDFVGEFNMVMGAHKERRIMLENNPREYSAQICFGRFTCKLKQSLSLLRFRFDQLGSNRHSIYLVGFLASALWPSHFCLGTNGHAPCHEIL